MLGLTYSVSEVHTHAYYAERAAALADCAELDRLYLKDPGGLLTPDAVRELAPHFIAAARGRPDRAAQPLHDRARALRLHGGAPGRLPRAAHGRGPSGARHLQPGRRDDASQPGGRGLLPPARSGRSGRGLGALHDARPGERAAGRSAAGVRRDVLPPSAGRRHGLDDTADARGAAPARAVSGRAGGGRPCPRRDGLPDHRHARSRSSWRRRRSGTSSTASAGQPSPTRRFATSSATTGAGRARGSRRGRPRARLAHARKSFAISSRSASKEHEPVSAGRSPTRSCCCG